MNVFPQKDRKQQYICVQRLRGFHLNPPGHRYSIIKKHCHHQCGQPFIKSLKLYGESHSGLSQHHTCTLSSHVRNSHVTDSHTMGRRLKTVPQLYEEKCYKDNGKKKDRAVTELFYALNFLVNVYHYQVQMKSFSSIQV